MSNVWQHCAAVDLPLLFCHYLQIHAQFPMSFEFNQFYLEFLAYHCLSNRFRTFMLDSECKRVEAGWMLEETKLLARSDSSLNDVTADGSSVAASFSVWDYIDEHHKTSTVFFNFQYSTSHDSNMVCSFCVRCVLTD